MCRRRSTTGWADETNQQSEVVRIESELNTGRFQDVSPIESNLRFFQDQLHGTRLLLAQGAARWQCSSPGPDHQESDMPKYSGVTFNVQPVEKQRKVSGYVVSGFLSKKQLVEFRNLVDSSDYKRSTMWRGEYMEMAQAIVKAVDKASA